jgi:hypothetical protein
MSTTTTFICPYCGENKDRAEQSLGHPLARALGGTGNLELSQRRRMSVI